MKSLTRLALCSLLVLLTVSCDRHRGGDDGFDFQLYISGSWSGSIHDSVCGDGEITFFFVQTGDRVSGSWRIVFHATSDSRCYDPGSSQHELSGPLTGSVNGGTVGLTLQRDAASDGCAFKQPVVLTGSWTGTRFTASYSGVSCSGTVSGTIDARR